MSTSYPVDEQVRDTLAYVKAVLGEDTTAQRVIADHGHLDLIADLLARMFIGATRQRWHGPAGPDRPSCLPSRSVNGFHRRTQTQTQTQDWDDDDA